jgi:hypothetical protein
MKQPNAECESDKGHGQQTSAAGHQNSAVREMGCLSASHYTGHLQRRYELASENDSTDDRRMLYSATRGITVSARYAIGGYDYRSMQRYRLTVASRGAPGDAVDPGHVE